MKGFNYITFSQDPHFIDIANTPYNLHLNASYVALTGDSSVGVKVDMDGDSRCSVIPSIGSDESKYIAAKPISGFLVSDTVYRGAVVKIQNNHSVNETYIYKWGVDQNYILGNDININYRFPSSGTHNINLITSNCSGSDTATKQVIVLLPNTTPSVDFVPTQYVIDEGEEVGFYNQSTGGDTAWEWTVANAASGIDYQFVQSTPYDYETRIQFLKPGKYEICLQAWNIVGNIKICKSSYIEVVPVVTMCKTSYSTDVKGNFYDDGGKDDDYGISGIGCQLLIAPCNGPITLNFKKYLVDNDFSSLRIWDGMDINGTLLFNSQTSQVNQIPATMVAKTGYLYVEWFANNYYGYPGWEAEWSTNPTQNVKPSANFTGLPSNVYIGSSVKLQTSLSLGRKYEWLVDGNVESVFSELNYTFNNAGNHDVCLIVSDCGGIDTLCKQVTVNNPTSVPIVDFVASYTSDINGCNSNNTIYYLTMGDTIKLQDISTQGPTSWAWSSLSSHVIFIDGTNLKETRITTDSTGSFDITLDASNSLGTSSATKNNFINVLPGYCVPNVQLKNSDIGMNSITMNGKNYTSESGISVYTDYKRTLSFCVTPGGNYPFKISRNTALNSLNCGIWIDLNQDGIYDATELMQYKNNTSALSWEDTLKVPLNTPKGRVNMRIGTTFWKEGITACGPLTFGEFEDYTLYTIPDNGVPEITILGNNPDYVERGKVYIDSGAIAWDAVDGYFKASASGMVYNNINVDSFYLSYDAMDKNGNVAQTQKRLVYVLPDNAPPTIKLNGDSVIYVDINSSYNDPGVTAYDSIYGNISSANISITGSVNIAKFGTYILSYKACDPKNNCASISRKVIVGDTTAPIIYLSGANPMTIEVGDSFIDPGVLSINDNYWKNLTFKSQSNVNNKMLGTYYVVYTSIDSSGNQGTETRVVNVLDKKAPEITLVGKDTIYLEATRNLVYVEPGYSASDNYFTALNWKIAGNIIVDKYHIGQAQNIVYEVSDLSGNQSSKTRTVILKKTSNPWLVLKGNSFETISWADSGKVYTDLGVNKYDAFYNDSDLLVSKTGNVDLTKPGAYELKYDIVDPNGNHAINILTRVVNVVVRAGISNAPKGEQEVMIYPNPAQDEVNIQIPSDMVITGYRIVDLFGKTIELNDHRPIQGNYKMNLGALAEGVYFIIFNADNHSIVKRVEIIK